MWVSAALAAIAFSVSISIRAEADRASTAADGLRAMYLATGSVDRAIQGLLWGTGSDRFFDCRYYAEKPRLTYTYPSGDVVVEMMPESAKLDINQASGEDLVRLVTALSGDPERARVVAAGILSWRGGGGGSSAGSAAPDSGSQSTGSTFQPRGASFEEIEELLLVRGMTPELYYGNYVADANGGLSPRGGLRDSLSVWGSTGPFDANAASPALLEALGASPGAIAQLVQRRAQQPFHNLGEVAALGIPTERLTVAWRAPHLEHSRHRAAAPAGWIAVGSGPFRFRDREAGAAAAESPARPDPAAGPAILPGRMVGVRDCAARTAEWGAVAMIPAGLRKFAAIGSGAGLEIAGRAAANRCAFPPCA